MGNAQRCGSPKGDAEIVKPVTVLKAAKGKPMCRLLWLTEAQDSKASSSPPWQLKAGRAGQHGRCGEGQLVETS